MSLTTSFLGEKLTANISGIFDFNFFHQNNGIRTIKIQEPVDN